MEDINLDGCEGLFDNIDDFLNFPCEDIEGDIVGGESNGLQDVWKTSQNTTASGCDSLFSGGSGGDANSVLPTELFEPCEDIAQLEWFSNFVEDSFSGGSITLDPDCLNNTTTITEENNVAHEFQTSSPISVLDSSSSSSSEIKTLPLNPEILVPGRARSKRPRPATFIPRPMLPLMSATSCITDLTPPFPLAELFPKLDNSAESKPPLKIPKPASKEPKKKKKVKLTPLSGSMEQSSTSQQNGAVRKCLHCEITKTPQWRAGPLGPKTLCNACGVRYKSGRLFPEYRPAASPTFVSTLHSNSHKKVLEMRTKCDQDGSSSLITYEGRENLLY